MRFAITGTTGFIGGALARHLSRSGHELVTLGRRQPHNLVDSVHFYWDLCGESPPKDALRNCDAVVHCAALAHCPLSDKAEQREHLWQCNVTAPARLAGAARKANVPRFVFLSSVGVHGRSGYFDENSPLEPSTLYAESKVAAETELEACFSGALIIVRPPLTYGNGAPGNIATFSRWAASGQPLPSGLRTTRRHFISIGNLCKFLELASTSTIQLREAYLVADNAPMTLETIYETLCRTSGRSPRYLPIPASLLETSFRLTRRSSAIHQLLRDLTLDQTKAKRDFGWNPNDDQLSDLKALVRHQI